MDSVWGWEEGWVQSIHGNHVAGRNACLSEESKTTKEGTQSRAESVGGTWVEYFLSQHSFTSYVNPSLISTAWGYPYVSGKGGVYGKTKNCSTGSPSNVSVGTPEQELARRGKRPFPPGKGGRWWRGVLCGLTRGLSSTWWTWKTASQQ